MYSRKVKHLLMMGLMAEMMGPTQPRMTTPNDYDETDHSTWEQHEERKRKAEEKRAMRNAKRLKHRNT